MGRWARRIFFLVIILIGIGCAIYVAVDLLLPGQVRRVVDRALAGTGLEGLNYEVRIATPWNTVLANIAGDGIHIGEISVEYSPFSVIRGQVNSVRIVDAEIDPTNLPNIEWKAPTTEQSQASGLPDRIEIIASAIRWNSGERPIRLPVRAAITRQEDGGYSIAGRTFFAGTPLEFNSYIQHDGSIDVGLRGSPQLAALMFLLPPGLANPHLHCGANCTIAMSARLRGNAANCEAEIKCDHLFLDQDDFHFNGGDLDLTGSAILNRHKGDWSVDLNRLHAQMTGDAILPGTVEAHDVNLDLQADGRLGEDGNELHVIPQTVLQASDLDWYGKHAKLAISLDSPIDITFPNGSWKATAKHFTVIATSSQLAQAKKPNVLLKLAGTAVPQEIALDILPGSTATVDAVQAQKVSTSRIPVMLSQPRAVVLSWQTVPADSNNSTAARTTSVLSVGLKGATTQPVDIKLYEGTWTIGKATSTITYSSEAGKGLAGQVELGDTSLHRSGLEINGISAILPFNFASREVPAGHIKSSDVVLNGQKFPGFDGEFYATSENLKMSMNWPAIPEGVVRAVGMAYWAEAPVTADLDLLIPTFDLTRATDIQKFTSGRSLEATGQLSAEAKFHFDGRSGWTENAALHLNNGSLRSRQYDADLSGINGNVTLSSVFPPETPGNQQLRVAEAHIGKFQVSNGTMQFRLESPQSLFIESTQFNFGGGTVASRGFRFDPEHLKTDMAVAFNRVQIADVLQLVSERKIQGTGWVFGRIPVKVNWPRFALGDGYLYAGPEGGTLTMPQASGEIRSLLESSDPRFRNDPAMAQIRDRVVAALQDFVFRVFRIDLQRVNGRLVTTITLQGAGRSGTSPQEINLNINVENLDGLISTYLAMSRGASIR